MFDLFLTPVINLIRVYTTPYLTCSPLSLNTDEDTSLTDVSSSYLTQCQQHRFGLINVYRHLSDMLVELSQIQIFRSRKMPVCMTFFNICK